MLQYVFVVACFLRVCSAVTLPHVAGSLCPRVRLYLSMHHAPGYSCIQPCYWRARPAIEALTIRCKIIPCFFQSVAFCVLPAVHSWSRLAGSTQGAVNMHKIQNRVLGACVCFLSVRRCLSWLIGGSILQTCGGVSSTASRYSTQYCILRTS